MNEAEFRDAPSRFPASRTVTLTPPAPPADPQPTRKTHRKGTVIIPGANGLLQLGERTKFGIQTSIENFQNFDEVQRFLNDHKIRADYEISRDILPVRHCSLLLAIMHAADPVASEIAKSVKPKTTYAWVVKNALRLSKYVVVEQAEGAKTRDAKLFLTHLGMTLALRLDGDTP